ncbi:DsbA family protein [Actinocorallia longicatena]|uniref:Thioredoxin domain-containing protein n=1 Tax=Actinocorallia longicatena TaxID=111803 RepID=A0ABP6QLN0_9ACTN
MSKATRDRTAREKLAEERRLQAQRDKQKRMLGAVGAAAAVIVVVVGVFVFVNSNRDKAEDFVGALAPTSRASDGSIVMAKAGVTSPVLEVFEDFQCPACKNLEKTSGNTFKQLAADGKAKVVYRPFRLFQQTPLKENSERAANAALCAPGDNWVPFHDKIYAEQPPEGKVGFSNSDLISWAAGLSTPITGDAFTQCVNGAEKSAQVQAMTDYALKVGKVESTPTVKLDGKDITNDAFVPSDLKKAVADAG